MSLTTLFDDVFTGSGNFDTHAPGTKLGGTQNWTDTNGGTSLSLSGGFVISADQTIGGTAGSASTGDGTSTYVASMDELFMTVVIVTGPVITPSVGRGISVTATFNGTYPGVGLSSDSTNWYLSFAAESAIVTLAANTSYTATLHVIDGEATLTCAGVTLRDVTNSTFSDTKGLNNISINVGDTFKIDQVTATGQKINAALHCPMFTRSMFGTVALPPISFLRETFTGSGALTGHSPDYAEDSPSPTWNEYTGGSTLSGGYLTGSFAGGNNSNLNLTTDIGPTAAVLYFTFKVGSAPTSSGDEFIVGFYTGGEFGVSSGILVEAVINLTSSTAANVKLRVDGTPTATSSLTVAANGTYSGSLASSPGAQQLIVGGITKTGATAYPGPGPAGIVSVELSVTQQLLADSISIDRIRPSFAVTLPHPTLSATGTVLAQAGAAMNLPMFTLAAGGGAAAQDTLPMFTLRGFFGGGFSRPFPAPSLFATAHNSYGDNAVIAVLPTPVLAGFAGANAAGGFPMPALGITGTIWGVGTEGSVLPMLSVAAAGTVATEGAAANALPMFAMVGYSGAVISVALSGYTFAATGTAGGLAGVAATLPMFDLTAAGTAQAHGSAELLLPMLTSPGHAQAWLVLPGLTLTAVGTATITATYEAYALNLHHAPGRPGEPVVDEMTRYTNFPFTHVVRYKNSYYGVASGALYLLEGVTDDTAPVAYDIKTAKTDFGTTEKKTILSAYFGGRLGAAETVTLVVGEAGTETYSYTTPRGPLAQSYRQVFGRGVKSRYFGLEVSGSDTFELDTIDLNVEQLTRRI